MRIIKTLGFEDESFSFEDVQSFLTDKGNFVVFNSDRNTMTPDPAHWIYISTDNEPHELSFAAIPYSKTNSLNKLNDWLQTEFDDTLCEACEQVPTINCADE